jgi:hypothetical protein
MGLSAFTRFTSGNRRLYNSSSLRFSGNGQFNPACLARCVYSLMVLQETRQARPTSRLDNPASYFNLKISLIFRTVNRSWDIATSSLFE